MLALHALHIEPGRSYRVAVDLLSEMPDVLEAIGPHTASPRHRPPHVVRTDSDHDVACVSQHLRRETHRPRRHRSRLCFDRDQPSRHYATCTHYRVRALKVTALVDVDTLHITDIHSTTSKKHDAKICPQVARRNAGDLLSLAADRGYDAKPSAINSSKPALDS